MEKRKVWTVEPQPDGRDAREMLTQIKRLEAHGWTMTPHGLWFHLTKTRGAELRLSEALAIEHADGRATSSPTGSRVESDTPHA